MAKFIDISGSGLTSETGGSSTTVDNGVAELLHDMYEVCLTKDTHDEAAETLYLMEKCLRKNRVTDEELLSLPDKVTEYFAKRNAPQPSTKPEGFFYGFPPTFAPMLSEGYTDTEIALALSRLVGNGCVINQKRKWAGAYWNLRWTSGYPVDVQEFCIKIAGLRLNLSADYECSYDNIRKLCSLSFMRYDFNHLEKVRVSNADLEDYAMCRQVAQALDAELRRIRRGE